MSAGDERGPVSHWCFFHSRSRPFAVPLQYVAEVIRDVRLARLPLGPGPLAGLCTLRREVLPVFDLVDRPAADRDGPAAASTILVLRIGLGVWGYLVDGEGIDFAQVAADPESASEIRWEGSAHAVIDPSASWHALRTLVLSTYRSRGAGCDQDELARRARTAPAAGPGPRARAQAAERRN